MYQGYKAEATVVQKLNQCVGKKSVVYLLFLDLFLCNLRFRLPLLCQDKKSKCQL